jgi:hypothetical protein
VEECIELGTGDWVDTIIVRLDFDVYLFFPESYSMDTLLNTSVFLVPTVSHVSCP